MFWIIPMPPNNLGNVASDWEGCIILGMIIMQGSLDMLDKRIALYLIVNNNIVGMKEDD